MTDPHPPPQSRSTPSDEWWYVCTYCGETFRHGDEVFPRCQPHILDWSQAQTVSKDGKVVGLRLPANVKHQPKEPPQ